MDTYFYDAESYNEKADKYFYPSLIATTIRLLIDINKILETETLPVLPVSPHPLIQKTLDYVHAHIEDNISVKTLANELYLSKGYLSHLFRKHMGMPLKQYIDLKKMCLAADLIDSGHNPTGVAIRLGYMNYSTFYQQFVRLIRRKPSTKSKSYIPKEIL